MRDIPYGEVITYGEIAKMLEIEGVDTSEFNIPRQREVQLFKPKQNR